MQSVYMYFDDSGVLHRNAKNEVFIYAGYCFVGRDRYENARRRYRTVLRDIKKGLGMTGEVKASKLKNKYKARLIRTQINERSCAVTVNISRMRSSILDDKMSIHRFKDYALKRGIKAEIQDLIDSGEVDPKEDMELYIYLDEQATASNGVYNLKSSVYEELQNGIHNFDYGTFYPPLIEGNLKVFMSYCNSETNYLIQSCDILANRIWSSYMAAKPELRELRNHVWMHLP